MTQVKQHNERNANQYKSNWEMKLFQIISEKSLTLKKFVFYHFDVQSINPIKRAVFT